MIADREGPQAGAAQWALVKVIPFAANDFRFGVICLRVALQNAIPVIHVIDGDKQDVWLPGCYCFSDVQPTEKYI